MSILSNVLLVLAAITFFILLSVIYGQVPKGGDAMVGYAWSVLILTGAFVMIMIITAFTIGAAGGFEWISPVRSKRNLWVTSVLLSSLFTFAMTALLKHEQGPVPGAVRIASAFVPVIIPVVLIGTGVILANQGLRMSVPVSVYKWPLLLLAWIGFTGLGFGAVHWMIESSRKTRLQLKAMSEHIDENQQRMLADIDSCDVMKDMVLILVMTDENQHPEVRARAVAKVRTHPDFEGELARRLQTPWATEVFTYLASNPVDHPGQMAEPVRQGILQVAALVRQKIREAWHASNFYEGMMTWEIDRVLRTADKYDDQGVDYRPAIRELRDAFDEPSDFEKPEFRAVKTLEKWIKKHP